jgi:diguanylate cyclase (GGDEF)-like protein/PAS domain S-box-containing protein
MANEQQATILVVDDVPDNLKVLFRYLSRHGFRVLVSEDAAKALEQIPYDMPDLILLDIMMPNMDGREMCRRLKANSLTREIPVIFMTALTDLESKVEGFEVGAVDYLTKPIQNAELMARINTHLRLHQLKQEMEQQRRELQVILDNSPMGIAFLSSDFRFWRVNDKMEALFGYSETELQSQGLNLFFLDQTSYGHFTREVQDTLAKQRIYTGEWELQQQQGKRFWCRIFQQAVDVHDPGKGFILNIEDITERRLAEEKMRLAHTVLETTTEGIIVTDAKAIIVDVNPAFTQITGYLREEVLGRTPALLNSGRQDKHFYQAMWDSLLNKGHWRGEIWNRKKNGEIFPEYLSIAAVHDGRAHTTHYVSIFYDISQRKQYEALIEHQANYDALTELPNRFLFMKRLGEAVEDAKSFDFQIALMFIDLDMFKEVNDTLGHASGDELLKIVAKRLSRCVRESDTVARLGGDEFTVILPHIKHAEHAQLVAEKLLHQLTSPFHLSGHDINISGSIGIALYPDHADELEALLKHADSAMYQAKNAGRNTFRFYQSA